MWKKDRPLTIIGWWFFIYKGAEVNDTILCHDKEDAKNCIDAIGMEHIDDWIFLPNGKIQIVLNCTLEQIKENRND